MRLSRTIVLGLIAVLLVGVVGGVATGAGKKKVRTKVTITHSGTDYSSTFRGRVKAKGKHIPRKVKRKCIKRRKVVVFRVQGGAKQRIGATKSNRRGRWVRQVSGGAEPGRYFARAKKKTFKRHGTKYVCKKGRSRRITVT